VSLSDAIDMSTPSGRAFAGMLSVFANFERDLISDRVLSGIGRTVALRAVEFVRRIPGTDCLTLRLQFKLV
jgi:hypothetical protein